MILSTARRMGFTLVELLVAMALAIVVLSLAVAVTQTGAFDSYKTTGAVDRLSQWLITAKSRAARDRQIRGVRLLLDPSQPTIAREAQYIEVPEPWKPTNGNQHLVFQQVIDEADPTATNTDRKRVLTTRVFLAQTPGSSAVNLADFELDGAFSLQALIRRNDTLLVPGLSGRGYRIVGITNPATPPNRPSFSPGLVTAAYPQQFHPPPSTPLYQPNLLNATCPPPGTAGNGSPLQAVVELQLGSAPDFAPGYSKFAVWGGNGFPAFPSNSPVYPPTLPPNYQANHPFAGQPVQLPYGGNTTAFNGPGVSPDMNPLNFMNGQFVDRRFPVYTTQNFSIQRAPRPLMGEPNLPMPKNMVVDFNPTPGMPPNTNVYLNYSPTNNGLGFIDILFAPNGELVNATNSVIVLVVRDIEKVSAVDLMDPAQFEGAGQLVMVVIQAKTGLISTKQLVPPTTNPDPFFLAKSAVNAGL